MELSKIKGWGRQDFPDKIGYKIILTSGRL